METKTQYLKVKIEFNHDIVDEIISNCIKQNGKGYICVVDLNSLAVAYSDDNHLKVLNNALLNICDSSWLPVYINKKYHTKFTNYCGPDFFVKYLSEKKYKYFFLGSNKDTLETLKINFVDRIVERNNFVYKDLPFCSVDDFDYDNIANEINSVAPDIIWVSLGAPKQEQFMAKLLPNIHKGALVGIGAAFDFYSGNKNTKRAPKWIQKMRLEWIYRLFLQPKKQFKRLILISKFIVKVFKNSND